MFASLDIRMKKILLTAVLASALHAGAQTPAPLATHLARLTGSALRSDCKPLERELSFLLAGLAHEAGEPTDAQLDALAQEIADAPVRTCAQLKTDLDDTHKAHPLLHARALAGLRRAMNDVDESTVDEE